MIIVAVTRFHDPGRQCVGAYALDDGASLRLLDEYGRHPPAGTFRVGEIWEADVQKVPHLTPPHLEDVKAHGWRKVGVMADGDIVAQVRSLGVVIHTDMLERAFDRSLHWTANDSGYVDEARIPEMSTCLWRSDRSWNLDGEGYYRAESRRGGGVRVRYVGTVDPPEAVGLGSIVRLSLARWWDGGGSHGGRRCYLQWSGTLPAPDESAG